jgi:hypothetical protein
MNTILLATKAVQNREFRGKVKKAGEVRLVSIAVLESRIWRKITEILHSGAPQPETDRCFRADGGV